MDPPIFCLDHCHQPLVKVTCLWSFIQSSSRPSLDMCFYITNLVMSVSFLMTSMAPHCLQGRMKIAQLGVPSSSKSGFHSGLKCRQYSPKKPYQLLKYWNTSAPPIAVRHPLANTLAQMPPGQSPGGRDAASDNIWHRLPRRHTLGWGPWCSLALSIDALAWTLLGTAASAVYHTGC